MVTEEKSLPKWYDGRLYSAIQQGQCSLTMITLFLWKWSPQFLEEKLREAIVGDFVTGDGLTLRLTDKGERAARYFELSSQFLI